MRNSNTQTSIFEVSTVCKIRLYFSLISLQILLCLLRFASLSFVTFIPVSFFFFINEMTHIHFSSPLFSSLTLHNVLSINASSSTRLRIISSSPNVTKRKTSTVSRKDCSFPKKKNRKYRKNINRAIIAYRVATLLGR